MRSKVFRESLQMGRENGIAVCNFPFFLPTRHLSPSTFHPPPATPSASSGHECLHLTPSRRAGFTLLELLVVITIMIFITTITVVNYLGIMRAAGHTAASNNVFNALLMARQRACVDNTPIVFYLLNSTNYVLQGAFGSITKIDPSQPSGYPAGCQRFFDQYGNVPQIQTNTAETPSRLINMDRPGTEATVCQFVRCADYDTSNVNVNGTIVSYTIKTNSILIYAIPVNGDWYEGDHYGIPLFAPQMLPNGFNFDPNPTNAGSYAQRMVVFNPDGTRSPDSLSSLTVTEQISSNSITFNIDLSGKIWQTQ